MLVDPPAGPTVITPEDVVPEELPAELLPGPPTVTLEEPLPEVPLLIPPL